MPVWDTIERIAKIGGIIGGLAAAGGVYVQLRGINDKDFERRVEDWQSAAVYQILEESRAPLSLQQISPQYNAKANNFPEGVPRTTLDENHLRVALIRLMQSQAVIETAAPGYYTVRREADQFDAIARAVKITNDEQRSMATHSQLAAQVLAQAHDPLTPDQLSQRIIAIGGNTIFLRENMPLLIETMRQLAELRTTSDGRIVAGPGQTALEQVKPSAAIAPLLDKIDWPLLKFVLLTDFDNLSGICYHNDNPVIAEQQPGTIVERLRQLGLLMVSVSQGGKDTAGKKCTASVSIEPTNLILELQAFYFQVLDTLISVDPTRGR